MRIVTPPLIVEEADSFKNDVLARKEFGQSLLNLIERSSDELVISLDGRWGEGKTTFVKMWQGLLAEANIHSIYIDAFANDYVDDAFITVASAITSYFEENVNKDDREKISELKDKAKKVGSQLLTWSVRLGLKAATMGIIKDSDLEDIKDDLSKGVSGVIGDFIEERFESHAKDIELIESFKKMLSETPSQLRNSEGKPLVIIIDELDRCKPTFAVEVLEKVKHLFSVKNVVFVLVMHKKQLEEAIKCVYGQKIDAHIYLQKFISLETTVPKRTEDRYDNDLHIYSQKLLKIHEIETWSDDRNIINCIETLASHFNLSLRQLEKVYTNLAIFYGSSAQNHLRIVPLIVFLSVVKVVNPPLFEKLLYKKCSYDDVCSETGLKDTDDEGREVWLMMWVKFAAVTEEEFKKLDNEGKIRNFGESLFRYDIGRKELIPLFARQLNMFIVS